MEGNKKFFWLKLKENFFDDEVIDWLREQENGNEYCLLYLMLCLKSLNKNGYLIREIGTMLVPYTAEKIADVTKTNLDTVRVALALFEKLGLIVKCEDGRLYIPQVALLTGSESSSKEATKKRLQRDKKKLVGGQIVPETGDKLSPVLSPKQGTNCPTEIRDKSIEYRDKSIEYRDKNIEIRNKNIEYRVAEEKEEKEEKENSLSTASNAFKLWDKNITPLTPIIGEKLKSLVEVCGEVIVCEAITEAAIYNKRSFGYVKAVAESRMNGVSGKKNAKTALDEELAKMGVDVGDW